MGAPKTTKPAPAFMKPTGKLESQQGTITHITYHPEGVNKSAKHSVNRAVDSTVNYCNRSPKQGKTPPGWGCKGKLCGGYSWILKNAKNGKSSRGGKGSPDRGNSVSIGMEARKCCKSTSGARTVNMKSDRTCHCLRASPSPLRATAVENWR